VSALTSQSRLLARGQRRKEVLNLAGASGVGRYTDAEYIERIKSKVTVTASGCWECAGYRHKLRNVKTHDKGYVLLSYRRTQQMAHRLAYRLFVGPIPGDLQVCHECDNPPCVNPDHLFLGDQNANMRDMADKKRNKAAKTHCIRNHPLSGDNVRLSPTKTGFRRQCLTCEREVHQKSERQTKWRRIYQRLQAGWTEEEARNTPLIPPGTMTERRVIGVRNRRSAT
jgi:hypothetical protein